MPHGLKGFHCAKVFAALEALRPAVNGLCTARALCSHQVSACSAAMSAIAIRSILKDLGFEQSSASYLLTNSKDTYAAARNPINLKLRHVNMQYHHVRQAIHDGHVCPHFVPSAAQIADISTKPLCMVLHKTGFLPKLCAVRTSDDGQQYGFRRVFRIHFFLLLVFLSLESPI